MPLARPVEVIEFKRRLRGFGDQVVVLKPAGCVTKCAKACWPPPGNTPMDTQINTLELKQLDAATLDRFGLCIGRAIGTETRPENVDAFLEATWEIIRY